LVTFVWRVAAEIVIFAAYVTPAAASMGRGEHTSVIMNAW
jgi:hypothetical protein